MTFTLFKHYKHHALLTEMNIHKINMLDLSFVYIQYNKFNVKPNVTTWRDIGQHAVVDSAFAYVKL